MVKRKRSRYPGLYRPPRSEYWHYRFMLNGVRVSRCTGEVTIEKAWERACEMKEAAKRAARDPYGDQYQRPLVEHLAEWRQALQDQDLSAGFVGLIVGRATRVIEGCGFGTWPELAERPSRVPRFLGKLRDADASDMSKTRAGVRTRNYHLQAIKRFCAWMVRDKRAETNPLGELQALGNGQVKRDKRHSRRRLTPEELAALFDETERSRRRYGISGRDRMRLYYVASETGLRANELRSVSWLRVNLDGKAPTVSVEAAYAKTDKSIRHVPLSDGAAGMLRTWRQERAAERPDTPVFRMPSGPDVAKMLRRDWTAARKAWTEDAKTDKERRGREASDFMCYVDSQGRYADFHAFRHTFASELAAAGVPPRTLADILGHEKITTTLEYYTHTTHPEQAEAVRRGLASRGAPTAAAAKAS